MKVTKNYLNQVVALKWVDPCTAGERLDLDKAPKGREALAKWEEFGLIDDITDGVVRLRYAHAWEDVNADTPNEAVFTWLPEELITEIEILKPEGGE